MHTLNSKTILITGASSGIGAAFAKKLVSYNCKVILVARREEKLRGLCSELNGEKAEFHPIAADISNEESVGELFKKVEQRFSSLDILVNNAGVGLREEVQNIETADWDRVIDINLKGVFLCSRAAVKLMLSHKTAGQLISVCSVASLYSAPLYSAYCASKHGVLGFLRSLKWELRKSRIKISAIFPARVKTEFFDSYSEKPRDFEMLASSQVADVLLAIARRRSDLVCLYMFRNFLLRLKNFVRGFLV